MEENKVHSDENSIRDPQKSSPRFVVRFLGSMLMNRLYSQTMQPWVMAEIHRKKKYIQEIVFEVVGETIRVSSLNSSQEGKPLLLEHSLTSVTRFAKLHQDPKCFAYLTRHHLGADFLCHVYLADSEEKVPQIFQALREASKGISSKSECGEQSPMDSSSHVTDGWIADRSKSLFEVKYVGRAKVGGKKVTSDDIDILAEKMMKRLEERQLERLKLEEQQADEEKRRRHISESSILSLPDSLSDVADELATESETEKPSEMLNKAELKSSHSKSDADVLPVTAAVSEAAGADGNWGNVIPALSAPLLKEEASSKHLPDQPFALQNNLQSDSDTRRGSLSASLERDLGNHGLEQQKRLWSSSVTGDVSRRRHSSQTEKRGGPELKLSFQEPSRGRQRQDSCDSQDSIGNVHRKYEAGQVMVLQIGQEEIILISLDKKMAILQCKFKDISSVSQGSHTQDLFGIVARESESRFICYILRCLSGSVVAEIMSILQMAFTAAYSRRGSTSTSAAGTSPTTQHQVCTTCPLYQLHRICQEINTMSSQAAYELLVKKVQLLPDQELNELNSQMQVEEPESFEESVEVMMIFLRQLCERKQKEHVHISETNKSCKSGINFLEDKPNLFEGLKNKAKKSFTTSFENLLNRGKRKEDDHRNVSWTTDSETSWASRDSSSTSTPDMSPINKEFHQSFPSPPSSPGPIRNRSATLDSLSSSSHSDLQQLARIRDVNHNKTKNPVKNVMLPAVNSPQLSESFTSSTASSPQEDPTILASAGRPGGSWRKVIFNRVCTPQHSTEFGDEDHSVGKLHDVEEIRAMWKKAILETLLLIRLEKDNHSIRARQEEGGATLCRKLEYQELTPCLKEITTVWEKMLSIQERESEDDSGECLLVEEGETVAHTNLLDYVKKGVPRSLRGQIWLFLMQQHQMSGGVPDSLSNNDGSYEDLLKQLTTHQHAILIDLGRTFPNHPYFSTSLGAGQLELFNLLKAYSLLDTEVGYCQGLSFIVGMLLMHMEEISAFHVLKYMMYDLGLRKQFRPNMVALQIKLYQLTRLLHDQYKDVYDHFEAHEISPTLYAAPWFLTLFASQFPLGFVARVFDLIFVQGIGALFKVALMLIGNHRALILQCDTFESIVNFLKITLPEMVQVQMERIINQAFELDIDKELQSYEVEYHVLSEEMTFSQPQQHHHHLHHQIHHTQHADMTTEGPSRRAGKRRMSIDHEMLYRLEHQNRALKNQNKELLEKLQEVLSQRESFENSVLTHQVERDKLRSHIQALELERAALLTAVAKLQKLVPPETLQHLNLSLPADPATSPSHPAPGETSCSKDSPGLEDPDLSQTGTCSVTYLSQTGTCSVTPADSVLEVNIFDQSRRPDQEACTRLSGDAARNSATCLFTADATPVTSSHKTETDLPSPALTISITDTSSSQNPVVTSCGQSGTVMSEVTLGQASIPVTSTMLSSYTPDLSSSLPSTLLPPSGRDQKRKNVEAETVNTSPSTAQHMSGKDLHTSTTVSSSRQTYSSRSISNAASSLPAVGSVTPEERRKSVKVVVQHSPTTRKIQQTPDSQK